MRIISGPAHPTSCPTTMVARGDSGGIMMRGFNRANRRVSTVAGCQPDPIHQCQADCLETKDIFGQSPLWRYPKMGATGEATIGYGVLSHSIAAIPSSHPHHGDCIGWPACGTILMRVGTGDLLTGEASAWRSGGKSCLRGGKNTGLFHTQEVSGSNPLLPISGPSGSIRAGPRWRNGRRATFRA